MDLNRTGIHTQKLHWYPGHMAKTRRLIQENLKLIDVVVEITDARIPFSGRNPNFDDIIKGKPRLIVMNKADLADDDITKEWINYYNSIGLGVIPISCATGMGVNKIFDKARELISEKIERDRERGINKTLKLMMVGIPNVGKSSLINRLSGKAGAVTGDRPGVTKGKQWIRIRKDAELLDTPGILPQKLDDEKSAVRLAWTGAIKDDIVNTEILSYSLLEYLRDNYPEKIEERYKLSDFSDKEGWELLEMIGRKRGCVISGGEIDTERAARLITEELRSCKVGKISLERVSDMVE